MNYRQLLHTIAAVASLLAAGTLAFPSGIATAAPYVVFVASIVSFALTTYLGSTTTGEAKP